jgi:hypothetical protein
MAVGRSKVQSKVRTRAARCSHVLAIMGGELQTLQLLREEIHPAVGDFADGPLDCAVVRWHKLEVCIPIDNVVFLRDAGTLRKQRPARGRSRANPGQRANLKARTTGVGGPRALAGC